ncbi:MAG: aldose epimerase family protein [Planctomycetota bacterium]|jgi:galactose mutarotase-like enzyme
MTEVSIGKYKDIEAIFLDNDVLKVVLLPEYGSKIASIVYKPLDYELLWQNPGREYKKTKYGDSYLIGEMSGFDEMFPTISLCCYEDYPWTGTEIPDHGEVWSIPWDYAIETDHVTLTVDGVRFPYTLQKTIQLNAEKISLKYKILNRSDFSFDFIWAAHPLFNTSGDMEIVVPKDMTRIINSVPGNRLGKYGEKHNFPIARLADGNEFNLALVPERNEKGYQKYFFLGKVTEGWCSLYDKVRKLKMTMEFPPEKVPYLGMWLNEGGFENQYNIAPEPATGAMDRIDMAKTWGMSSVLQPKESREWWLNILISKER